MGKLQDFISKLKTDIPENLSELEQARFTYINLGKILKFSPAFSFDTPSVANTIYKNSLFNKRNINNLEHSMEASKTICVDIAHLYKYVLSHLGIECEVIHDNVLDHSVIPHWYNLIKLSDGTFYFADLQNDLKRIHCGDFTRKFGAKAFFANSHLSEKEIFLMDRKIGYVPDIPENEPKFYYDYSSNYLLGLKKAIANLPGEEKLDFIFKYGNSYTNMHHTGINELFHYYNTLVNDIFSETRKRTYNILSHTVCNYINENSEREYVSCLSYPVSRQPKYYIYSDVKNPNVFSEEILNRFNENKGTYIPVSTEELLFMLDTKLKLPHGKSTIPGLPKKRNTESSR